ncbi:MAG: terminase TerL endonuclease subunit [Pseudomonadota bacterium]
MTAWNLSCPDWESRIRAGRSLIPALPLDRAAAARGLGIFDKLRLPDVPGKPAMGEAAGEWFREIVEVLFGSMIGGERMVREPFLLVPKKNSKTSGGAALMLTALLLNERPRAELLFVGPTKMVADLAFSQAIGMIEADEEGFLGKRLHVQEHVKQITDRRTKAKLLIKTFDSSVLTGVKPAAVLLDELHEIARNAAAARIIGQIRGGMLPNPEAFLAFITTQSDEPPSGAFRAELMAARAIRDGRASGKMLPVLYEFPAEYIQPAALGETPRWADPSIWWMVNPNRDRSITIARLEEDYEKATLAGEEEIRRWASQHLNLEIGLALRSDRWAGADFWERQADPLLTLESILERSEVVCIGIDGGGLDDLLGLAVLGRDAKTRDWLLWCHAWAHTSVLDRRKSEAPRLKDFDARGDLTIVTELGEDIRDLAQICATVDETGKLAMVGLDPMGIGAVVDALAEKNIAGDRVVGVTQGWKLTGAIKTGERKLAEGTLWHCGQTLMAWCVGNARVEPKGNAIVITKQASGTAKIDPLMASLNGISLMSTNPEAQPPPFYERHGLLVLGQ